MRIRAFLGICAAALSVATGSGCLGDIIEAAVGEALEETDEIVAAKRAEAAAEIAKSKTAGATGSAEDEITKAMAQAASSRGPAAKIPAASQTPECAAELSAALAKFRDDQGLGMKLDDSHAQALFAEGGVKIEYARDGVRHIPGFALAASDAGCVLKFASRGTQRPGQTSVDYGNYGTVPLTVCKCE